MDLEQLVVVARAAAGTNAKGEGDNDVDNEEEEQQLLATRLAGKVVELAGQQDVDSLCDSAASLLTFGEQQQRRDTVVDGGVALTAGQKAAELSLPTPLSDADMVMSPAEHAAANSKAREHDPEWGSEATDQRAQSLAGAEAKRAEKAALREKKRIANQAQQLDTPFYVAVAQGGPKARFRAPVPMVKSRITERLSSAASPGAGEEGVDDGAVANTRLEFGPLVLNSPASDCLLAAGIKEPTGIQKAGMGPIFDGESVILHAMTGSGKTLTFLLPLMQRWAPGLFSPEAAAANNNKKGTNGRRGVEEGADAGGDAPWQVLLALPTRELAVQVAREVVLLSGGLTASVELLVDASVFHDLSKVTAPIVVGSAKVLERCDVTILFAVLLVLPLHRLVGRVARTAVYCCTLLSLLRKRQGVLCVAFWYISCVVASSAICARKWCGAALIACGVVSLPATRSIVMLREPMPPSNLNSSTLAAETMHVRRGVNPSAAFHISRFSL